MPVTAIIAAGGRGTRLGAPVPKQLLRLGGRPILQWSVETFLAAPAVDHVVAVLPPDLLSQPPDYLLQDRVTLVPGGERRQDSVARGLEAVPGGTTVVVDSRRGTAPRGRRPDRAPCRRAAESGAAIAGLCRHDPVKDPAAANGVLARTLRGLDLLAQRPGFPLKC